MSDSLNRKSVSFLAYNLRTALSILMPGPVRSISLFTICISVQLAFLNLQCQLLQLNYFCSVLGARYWEWQKSRQLLSDQSGVKRHGVWKLTNKSHFSHLAKKSWKFVNISATQCRSPFNLTIFFTKIFLAVFIFHFLGYTSKTSNSCFDTRYIWIFSIFSAKLWYFFTLLIWLVRHELTWILLVKSIATHDVTYVAVACLK